MIESLRVTLVQSILHWENVSANLEMFSAKLEHVDQTDLIVLPETFTTGFCMNVKLAEEMDGQAVQWMRATAASKNCAVCGSLMITEDGRYFNRLIWMQPDGTCHTYDKHHLFCISDEPKFFTPGQEHLIVDIKGWKFSPFICYDLRFPVWMRNKDAAYDVLVCVANWPEKRNVAWKTLLPARAIENQAYVVAVNRIGADGNSIPHSGDSMVIDASGDILYQKSNTEDIFTAELQYELLIRLRTQLPFLNDADDFVVNQKLKFKSH